MVVKCFRQETVGRTCECWRPSFGGGEKVIRFNNTNQQLDKDWCYWITDDLLSWTDAQHR